jgi:hypothetical protein
MSPELIAERGIPVSPALSNHWHVIPGDRTVLAFRHRCVLCADVIDPDAQLASILVSYPDRHNAHFQVHAHLDCLKRAAHPEMVASLDPNAREREWRAQMARLNDRIEAMPWWKRWRWRREVRWLGVSSSDLDA